MNTQEQGHLVAVARGIGLGGAEHLRLAVASGDVRPSNFVGVRFRGLRSSFAVGFGGCSTPGYLLAPLRGASGRLDFVVTTHSRGLLITTRESVKREEQMRTNLQAFRNLFGSSPFPDLNPSHSGEFADEGKQHYLGKTFETFSRDSVVEFLIEVERLSCLEVASLLPVVLYRTLHHADDERICSLFRELKYAGEIPGCRIEMATAFARMTNEQQDALIDALSDLIASYAWLDFDGGAVYALGKLKEIIFYADGFAGIPS